MPPNLSECCYCSLLCSETSDTESCPRRMRVLAQPLPPTLYGAFDPLRSLLSIAQDDWPLIWVDSADVGTMREVIRFAEICDATVHIGQSTGTRIQKRITASEGWLGASLNEAALHADLVISLGDSLPAELPQLGGLLATHTSHPKTRLHIGSTKSIEEQTESIVLPRQHWYEAFSQLLHHLRDKENAPAVSPQLAQLGSAIEASRYAVIVWQVDEFLDEIDELLLRRLSELARFRSQTARLALVCIDPNCGRVTAHETMLWATGFAPTATFNHGAWHARKDLASAKLDEFQQAHSSILMIRTTCSGAALPAIAADLALLPTLERNLAPESIKHTVSISGIGDERPGFLFRGDHSLVLNCQPTTPEETSPAAADLLAQATQAIANAKRDQVEELAE